MPEAIDVVLVNPGNPRQVYQALGDEFCALEPPAFAGLFATYLRRRGLSVTILDQPVQGLAADEIARLVDEDLDPALVAIVVYGFQPSASTQNMTAAGEIAGAIRARRPDRRVLMTGTHPAALPERTLDEEAVDFVCDREGPVTLYKVASALKAGADSFDGIASLWWRDAAGGTHRPTAIEDLVDDLDQAMPGIAWDLLPMDRYRAHNWHAFDHIHERQPYAAIHTSLGCPYRCSFCCINAPFGKPAYRMWSPDAVVAEIDFLVERYGVKNIKIVDEMFVLNKRHVLGICERLIERGHDLNIWAYARVDTVKEGLLEPLAEAGFRWLCLGIESADSSVRDGASKTFKDDDVKGVVRRIQDAGINVLGNYIFGLPDDTHERMQATLDLAQDLECEFANFYSAMAYPGSALFRQAEARGIPLPRRWHHYSQHAYETTPLASRHLSAAEILAFRDDAWQRYFTAPAYLDLLRRRFGQDVVDHVRRMTQVGLSRRLLEDRPAA